VLWTLEPRDAGLADVLQSHDIRATDHTTEYNVGMSMPGSPLLDQRRDHAFSRWGLAPNDVVLVRAGGLVEIPATDMHYPFYCNPDFLYLAGRSVVDGVIGVDASGEWQLFAPRPSASDKVWHAATEPLGVPLGELESWLASRVNVNVRAIGASSPIDDEVQSQLHDMRVRKDAFELTAMRDAAAATAAGFAALVADTHVGRTEHQLRATIDAEFLRSGGDRPAYDSIVAGGPNSAVLHFAPSRRAIAAGDFLLVDAGASVDGYACDVTRTWVVGDASPWQRTIWEIVLEAQLSGIARCVPGQEYREIHIATAEQMAAGLVAADVLRGVPADLVAKGAMAIFFPHGVGHLIGLEVHDVAGYDTGRERSGSAGLQFLRTDRGLADGAVVTVEPGIYFIDALLDDPALRTDFAEAVNWKLIDDELRGIGGVRIEDTVHVCADGPEVLSGAIPKTLEIS